MCFIIFLSTRVGTKDEWNARFLFSDSLTSAINCDKWKVKVPQIEKQ